MLENAHPAAAVAKGPQTPGTSSCYAKTGAAQTRHIDNAKHGADIAHKKIPHSRHIQLLLVPQLFIPFFEGCMQRTRREISILIFGDSCARGCTAGCAAGVQQLASSSCWCSAGLHSETTLHTLRSPKNLRSSKKDARKDFERQCDNCGDEHEKGTVSQKSS